jgi:hypothetical protein
MDLDPMPKAACLFQDEIAANRNPIQDIFDEPVHQTLCPTTHMLNSNVNQTHVPAQFIAGYAIAFQIILELMFADSARSVHPSNSK